MVSEDIQQRRDEYLQLIADHAAMSPADLAASLASSQRDLLDVIAHHRDPVASAVPAPGEWCLRELTMHAAFTERLVARLVHDMSRGAVPTADAFDRAGIGMMPVDDGRAWSAVLDELNAANQALLTAIRGLPAHPDAALKLPHPFFGPLTALEWAGFQRVHDTDHIQHARKIIAAVVT